MDAELDLHIHYNHPVRGEIGSEYEWDEELPQVPPAQVVSAGLSPSSDSEESLMPIIYACWKL